MFTKYLKDVDKMYLKPSVKIKFLCPAFFIFITHLVKQSDLPIS